MNELMITALICAAREVGFEADRKDGSRLRYAKNLKLISGRFPSPVYVHLETGVSVRGVPRYLKVGVHPQHFREEALDPARGIDALLNNRTKTNFFRSSNWKEFPCWEGSPEPVGRCYRIETPEGSFAALTQLLRNLAA